MKIIRIIIASTSELVQERKEFMEFLNIENDRLHNKGINLELVQREVLLDSFSQTKVQDEYIKEIERASILICLFYSRAGLYTQEEFNVALKHFKEHKKPLIYNYFKTGAPEPKSGDRQVEARWKFKRRLTEIGHFYSSYKNIEELKNQFRKQLDRLVNKGFIAMQEEVRLETKDAVTRYFNTKNTVTDGNVHIGGLEDTKNQIGNQKVEKIYNIDNIGNADFTSGQHDKKPDKQNDEVSCTLYAPQEVMPGDQFLVQVFAHTDEQSESIEKLAHLADDTSTHRGTSHLSEVIERNTKIDFNLILPGLTVDEPTLSVNWKGKIVFVQFGVLVPNDFPTSDVIGNVIIAKNSIPIGKIKFKLKIHPVKSNQNSLQPENSPNRMKKFQEAFISYASQDRRDVLKRVQMLNLIKLKFFQDLLTLEPGEKWEKELYNYIDTCDVFFLFWSKAASESPWVMKELKYAIQKKGNNWDSAPEIIPVIIEGPPMVKPPEELSFLHFNDKFVYFINADR